jgi:hypothetical protein
MKKTKNYYRKITESLPHPSALSPHLLGYFTLASGLLAVALVVYMCFLFLKLLEVKEQRLQARDSLSYWENVVARHPNFTDGYYNAGFYSYVIGDRVKAIKYIDGAIALDPGFEKALELEKLIRK